MADPPGGQHSVQLASRTSELVQRLRISASSFSPFRVWPQDGRSSASLRSIRTRSTSTSDSVLINRIVSAAEREGDIARLRRMPSSSWSVTRSSGCDDDAGSTSRTMRGERTFVNCTPR